MTTSRSRARRQPSAAPEPGRLAEYRRKRDFTRTEEPSVEARLGQAPDSLAFVIQKHHASHLHFDLRLEVDGVMKSWAVPKGPSRDPQVKRLAMRVEDHPIAYNQFEGTIPKGQYGGGTVMIWDRGTYGTPGGGEDEIRDGLAAGRLKISFRGERLQGQWILARMRNERQWLLIKHHDEHDVPDDDLPTQDIPSVVSGRRMSEITDATAPKALKSRKSSKPTSSAATSPAALSFVADGLREIEAGGGNGVVEIPGAEPLRVSHLDKVYFPKARCTKGDLMRYYERVAPALLPLIADRPLVLKRYPNGVTAKPFFQQNAPDDGPSSLRVESVPSENTPGRRIVGGDLYTLLYCVQLGAIDVNPWQSRIGSIDCPDYTILDLDPGPKATFASVVRVALALKELLDGVRIRAGVKTSGSRGLHLVIPLPPDTSEETGRLVAQLLAEQVAHERPKEATVTRSRAARPATAVYVDYLQNIVGKSVASAFSVRPRPEAAVSTPLSWDEVTTRLRPDTFTMEVVMEELDARGSLWHEAMGVRNRLAALT